jgi:hypothetical protein
VSAYDDDVACILMQRALILRRYRYHRLSKFGQRDVRRRLSTLTRLAFAGGQPLFGLLHASSFWELG